MAALRKMTLDEFKASPAPKGSEDFLKRFNHGSFMECHCKVFAETGIWIKELVPVFQKLDAMLISRDLPREVA